jgi:hypothetical protein
MAKAKKRIAARKKTSKRGKVSAKPARKTGARHATPKKSKFKAPHAGISGSKPAAKKTRPLKTVQTPRQVTAAAEAAAEILVRTNEPTVVDVIEEPAPGVVVVTEYESSRRGASTLPGGAPQRGESSGPETEEQ